MRLAHLTRYLMLAFLLLTVSSTVRAQVSIAIRIAPPPLVVYEQPICPGDGYIWTPGFWSYDYDNDDYFWVPGTWVLAPEVGFFWTPGYWGWGGDGFFWNEGYWGPEIGFYGGINYGFGYFGTGYVGGRWDHGHFFYNTTINRVDVTVIHNVYNERVDERTFTRVSFNGGDGGVNARPSAREATYSHENHVPRVAAQNEHIQAARSDPQQRFSTNHGAPGVAATPRPGALRDGGVVRAQNEAVANRPNERPGNNGGRPENNNNGARSNPVHPSELPAMEHPTAPNTGNPKTDQKYQQQQEKLMAKQQQERQKLQQQQDKEHQQLAKQNADDSRKQQVEQKHAQQTQQLQQRHQQQQQQMQQRQAPPPSRPQPTGRPH